MRNSLREHFQKRPIYLVTDGGALRREGKLLSSIELALEGGAGKIGAVQIREQSSEMDPASHDEILKLCRAVRSLCKSAGAHLILNLRKHSLGVTNDSPLSELPDLVDGFHLGFGSPPIDTIRKIISPKSFIGTSVHSKAEALNASGADYLSYAPVFEPLSKSVSQIGGLDGLREIVSAVKIPVIALGGITKDNFASCLEAGAAGAASITSILCAPSPLQSAKEFAAAIRPS